MSKMEKHYDHIFNLNPKKKFATPFIKADDSLYTQGRKGTKLDGYWNFSIDVYNTFYRKEFYAEKFYDTKGRDIPVDCDFDKWEKVYVPSNWNTLKPEYLYYEGSAVYTRKFQYHGNKDNTVYLKIGAANYEASVWLNGVHLGRHQGGFTPFTIDVTNNLQKENRLIIEVDNTRKVDQIPSINYDWFNYGGIYRSVELFEVPKKHIKDMFLYLVPNDKYNNISFEATACGFDKGENITLKIPELGIDKNFEIDETGKAKGVFEAMPQLWSCETPKLYEVIVSAQGDEQREKIGFKQIKTEGKNICLNGKPIYFKGVCCHEESETNGRALTDDERIHMLKTAKEMGCNIVRLSHYPHSEKMAQIADELGIMLWEEIPVYWALMFEEDYVYDDAACQLKELILRDRNRASVACWGIGNENPDTDERFLYMSKLNDLAKQTDPSRPTCAACLFSFDTLSIEDRLAKCIDIVAVNEYCGWYYRDYEILKVIFERTNLDKPLVISETGASAACGHFGDDEELYTEDHQAKVYKKQFEYSNGNVQGLFPWLLFDFKSPVRMNAWQNKYNIKGLVSADKQYKKQAYYTVKEEFEKIDNT